MKWHGKTQFLDFCLKNYCSHFQDHLLSFLQCKLVPFSDTSLNQYVHFWGFQRKSRPKYKKHLQKRYRSSYFAQLFLDEIQQQKSTHPNSESITLTFLSNFLHLWRSSFPLRFWHSSSKASSGLVSSLTCLCGFELEAENPTEHQAVWRPQHEVFFFFVVLFCLWSTPSQMGFR